jgi:hypothetical protein
MLKIGETLFVHGGVSPRVAAMELGTVNETIRAELKDFSKLQNGLTLASDGPLWYRGLAQSAEEELAAHVEAVLKAYGVKRVVIGHTPTAGTVIPRFGGRVLMVDVGLSAVYGSRRACLVIDKGVPYTLHRGKRIDLPDATPAGLLAYLKRAAALDPAPSPLNALIDGLAVRLSAVPR